MSSALGTKRWAFALLLGLAFCVSCGARWLPAKTAEVPTARDPQASYTAVLEVAGARRYRIVSKDEAAKKVRLQATSNGNSFIDIEVVAGDVKLAPAGALVRDGKVHKVLMHEVDNLQADLKQKLGGGAAPAADASANAAPGPVADASGAPVAWTEPAYDPSVWGNGNFTCLPVRVPADHQAALTLQLTNGEKADLQLSLAYDAGLCRSPSQCKQAGGCPALGIGDTERVNRLAGRLSRGEVGSQAILLDSGKPVATIDLSHHGSIVQALTQIKH
jgi:hypothetical protein